MSRPPKSKPVGTKAAKPGTPPQPELAPVPNSPPPSLVEPAKKVEVGTELKKKELIDRVLVQIPDAKKKDAKLVIEAMLAVLGQSMTDGEKLNVQPFGKLRVQKQKDLPNGQVLTLKLRRSSQSLEETEGLAEPDDEV